MPQDGNRRFESKEQEAEYRRQQAAKAKRRKKRQQQRILLIAAFAVVAVLLILCIVMIFRAIFGGDKAPSSTAPSSSVASVYVPPPAPTYNHPIATDPNVWNLKLVNSQMPLPADHSMVEGAGEGELGSIVQNGVKHYFDNRIVGQLAQMIGDCNAQVENGSLRIWSGYRGANRQNEVFQTEVTRLMGQGKTEAEAQIEALRIEPPAGNSEHQTGLAVDFVTGTVQEPSINFAGTLEFQWLSENAAQYGFIIRFPSEKEDITGVAVQPYHFRYVGVEDAQNISGYGICLEEYLLVAESTPASTEDTGAPDSDVSASPVA